MSERFQAMSAAERTDGARRRILDEKAARGGAVTDTQALTTRYRSMKASEGLPRRVRRGMRTRDGLAAMRFVVDDFDLLAGRPLFSLDHLRHPAGIIRVIAVDNGKCLSALSG